MKNATIVKPLTIPRFGSTEEAIAWGATIPFFAVALVQANMRELDAAIAIAKGEGQLQRMADLATRRQLLRESIEGRTK